MSAASRGKNLYCVREPQPILKISASRLAAALAKRLDSIVPPPFRVRAEGNELIVDHPTGWGLWMPLEWIEAANEDRGAGELAQLIAGNALDSVQDAVCESSREPWPELTRRVMALPGTRRDDSYIYLWYGPSERSAVISMDPLPLATLVRPG